MLAEASRPQDVWDTSALEQRSRIAALGRLTALGTELRIERGVALVRLHNLATHVYVVKSGLLVSRELLDARRLHATAFWYPNEIIGLGDAYGETAAVDAAVVSFVWRVPRHPVAHLAHRDHEFAAWLNHVVATQLAALRAHILLLQCRSARQRLSRFLLGVARRHGWQADRANAAWLPMSQADIGEYLGINAETISRSLAELRREGLIGPRRKGFVALLDIERLKALAG